MKDKNKEIVTLTISRDEEPILFNFIRGMQIKYADPERVNRMISVILYCGIEHFLEQMEARS